MKLKTDDKRGIAVVAMMVVIIAVVIGGLVFTVKHQAGPAAKGIAPSSAPAVDPESLPDAKPVKYYSAGSLWKATTDKGLVCNPFKTIKNATNGSIDMGGCNDFAVIYSIYANEEDTQNAPTVLYTVGGGPVYMVLGPNWSINCDSLDIAYRIATETNGELVKIEMESK
jgi:hypothetical protein